jgi:putative membrane protein
MRLPIALTVIALVLAACAGQRSDRAADPAEGRVIATTLEKEDRIVLASAAQIGLLQHHLSTLALRRGVAPATGEFARRVLADHQVMTRELEALAIKKNLPLPREMDARTHRQVEQVSSAWDKDLVEAYLDAQLEADRQAIALLEDAVRTSDDPDVRAFAEARLPVFRQHLDHGKRLQRSG